MVGLHRLDARVTHHVGAVRTFEDQLQIRDWVAVDVDD